ncbi:hypothetical protein EON65_08235 [archaeon]|nr:MAG: hypothetical protein EON65_08235 [archaeon]
MARSGLEIEMSCRCAVFLLLCHQHQIAASATLAPILIALRDVVLTTIGSYRFMTGVNLAGLYQMQQTITQDMEDIEANKQILTKDNINKKNKKKRKAAASV